MLQKQHDRGLQDFSSELRESRQWKAGELRRLHFPKDVTAFAFDPVVGLLAVGTAKGSIYLFGRPGVHTILASANGISVKFLLFSVSTARLVCLGDDNQLATWDLSSFGQPKLLATARFEQTNCILTSPSHCHVFLVMHTGEVRAYDLLCLRKSPYTLPNLWDIYKRKTAPTSSGRGQSSRTSVEIVPHPRDLNLLFVAYAGGVVLSDLTQREVIRAYEYTVPPGAPGGTGYGSPDILTLRQPSVTCMAIHPAGHFFAIGYTDGSVAFWALEDEDQPLLAKTLEADDVNIVNKNMLDQLLSSPGRTVDPLREPVFKLSWSGFSNSPDPRGGKTLLTVLGGLSVGEPPGLTVFELPAFNPPDLLPSSPVSNSFHPHFRSAMRESLVPLKTYFYPTQHVVQDYLLVPRDNPHYAGAFDPVAIILMTGSDANVRHLYAFEYPPPAFKEGESDEAHKHDRSAVGADELANELAATLMSLLESNEPRRLRMPALLCISAAGLLNGNLLTVDRSIYQTYADEGAQLEPRLNLGGGNAWADATRENDMAFAKYQPYKLMATYNHDSTVQVFDLSAQLLSVQISEDLRPKTLVHEFPNPISSLEIDICAVFGDSRVAVLIHTDKVPRITSLDFSPGYACAIGVETGHLMVFRDCDSSTITPCATRELPDVELIPLGHIETSRGKRHAPHFMVSQTSKQIEISSITNIGFLAVSYSDGLILVVDITVPRIVWRRDPPRKKSRHSINLHIMSENVTDPAVDLVWTICGIGKDSQPRLRLVAIHLSGVVDIVTFVQDADGLTWKISNEPVHAEAIANPLQRGSFIIDGKMGAMLGASRERLFLTSQQNKGNDNQCLFITTGTKGARVYAEVNGQRISKTSWASDSGHVQTTQIVERMGSYVLVSFTNKHLALVYALPHLEHLHTVVLPPVPSLPPSIDSSGDFIALSPHPLSGQIHEALYGTLFDFRRVYSQPDVELIPSPLKIPSQPQPVSLGPASVLGAWFRYSLSMTGDQFDTLVGGPERPVPQAEQREAGGSQAAELASKAAAMQNELYGRLTSALSERGHMLEDLGERFNALEAGSRSMVEQAKRLAAQQGAKSWFGL